MPTLASRSNRPSAPLRGFLTATVTAAFAAGCGGQGALPTMPSVARSAVSEQGRPETPPGHDRPRRVIRGEVVLGGFVATAYLEAPRFAVDIPNISTPSNPIERSPHAHGDFLSAGMSFGDPHFLGFGTAEIDGEVLDVVVFGGNVQITTGSIASPTALGPFEAGGPAALQGVIRVYGSFADRNTGAPPLAEVELTATGRATLVGTRTALGVQVSGATYRFGTDAVGRRPGT